MNELSHIIDIDNIGLYLEDGLGIFESLSGSQIERKKKNIIKVFKMCGLSIIVTTNITSVDFLDVTFNLKPSHINHLENQIMNLNTLTSAIIIPYKS